MRLRGLDTKGNIPWGNNEGVGIRGNIKSHVGKGAQGREEDSTKEGEHMRTSCGGAWQVRDTKKEAGMNESRG